MIFGIRPQVDVAHLDEVGMYMSRNEPVPADLILKCRRNGEALLKTEDAAWGWTTVVACAAAAWDVDEAQRLARNAINAIGDHPVLLANLSVSFKHLCRVDLAVQYSSLAHKLVPHEAGFVLCYCDDLFMLGQFSRGLHVASSANRLTGSANDKESVQHLVGLFQRVVADLDFAAVSESQVQSEVALALQVMAETRNRYDGCHMSRDDDPEDGSCSLAFNVDFFGSLEDELRLGSLLAPRLSDLPKWDPCSLNTGFAYQLREQHADVSP
jgi:hypothetical protein